MHDTLPHLGAAAGIALAVVQIDSLSALRSDWMTIAPHVEHAAVALADPRALAAFVVAAVSTLYAFLSATPRAR